VAEKRLSKRQIREDPLLLWTARIEAYAESNWRRLLIAFGGVVLLVLLGLVIRSSREKAELQASELLAQAQVQLWSGSPVEAAQIAQQVIERSPGTRSGRNAYLIRADALLTTGDIEGSIAAYRTFLEREKRDRVLKLSARRGLAVALEDAGQFVPAAELNEELGREERKREEERDDPPGALAAHDLLAAARCRESAGDAERARALYEEVIQTYAKDAAAGDAKLKLAEMTRRAPVAASP
jgi:tetratricopeptide (TPR) repeat protein